MDWFINCHGSKSGYFFSAQNAVRASRQNKIFVLPYYDLPTIRILDVSSVSVRGGQTY
jgi:hypothetical protein